jgi:transposase
MTKAVKYTPEQETQLIDQYQAGMSLDEIATMFGKSVKSVVAKLAGLGIYKAKTSKPAKHTVTKADLVSLIEGRYAVEPGTLAEMEKLTKATLTLLARED